MQNKYNLLVLIFVASLAMACEEVIDIDLNSAQPALVAEAVIEPNKEAWIRLSYTSDYFDAETPVRLEDATVTLTTANNQTERLQHQGDGLYTSVLKGAVREEYTLHFQLGDNSYSATTRIPQPCQVMELGFEEGGLQRPGSNDEEVYTPNVAFTDNPSENNFYLIKFWINDELEEDYYLIDDSNYTQDGIIEYQARRLTVKEDDKVKLIVYAIDEATHTYYSQLSDNMGEGMGNSSTPFNPKSNFGEGVLGFFVGWSQTEFVAQVK